MVIAALTLALSGCGAGSDGTGQGAIDPVGSWGQTDPGQPNLELDPDGSFTGTDGCNRLGGSWEADGNTVTFSHVFSTLMACEDIDTWLSALAAATVSPDSLLILDEDGKQIGTLERAG